jgi:hypothetical protein
VNGALALMLLGTMIAEVDVEEAKQRAGELVTRGNELFQQNQLEAALAAFEEAYRTFPSPKIHYNLARTLAAVGRPLEAIDQYERFVADAGLDPGDGRLKKAQEEVARLEDLIGKLAFVIDIRGSMLSLDEEPPRPLPDAAIRVMPGPHRVQIETPDGRRFRETVDVAAGETVRVHVLFPSAAPPPAPIVAAVAPPPEEPTPITSEWWFWTAIGVAAVAIGVGVGVGVARGSGGTFEPAAELDVSSTAEWEMR